jgi:hypothetical protein
MDIWEKIDHDFLVKRAIAVIDDYRVIGMMVFRGWCKDGVTK